MFVRKISTWRTTPLYADRGVVLHLVKVSQLQRILFVAVNSLPLSIESSTRAIFK